MFVADFLDICDPVFAFDRLMEEAEVGKYLRSRPYRRTGRPGYDRVKMLKTVLFGFMEHGYAALRTLDDSCRVNLRYMYLMDWETPSYGAFGYFIREELQGSIIVWSFLLSNLCLSIPNMEDRKGKVFLQDQLQKVATPEAFVEKMKYGPHASGDVLLITGVGKVYPFMRSHSDKVLSLVHPIRHRSSECAGWM